MATQNEMFRMKDYADNGYGVSTAYIGELTRRFDESQGVERQGNYETIVMSGKLDPMSYLAGETKLVHYVQYETEDEAFFGHMNIVKKINEGTLEYNPSIPGYDN